jgi:hypothetical protein
MRLGHERFVVLRPSLEKKTPKRSSAAIFSAFLLAGCASATAEASYAKRTPYFEKAKQSAALVSKAGHASCRFEKNRLTYSLNGNEKTIKLDVKTADAGRMICSDGYTVLLTPDRAVVSLGAKGVLSGKVSLGMLGKKVVMANSYSVDIKGFMSEGIKAVRIRGRMLHITTRKSIYYLDLSNPFGWLRLR